MPSLKLCIPHHQSRETSLASHEEVAESEQNKGEAEKHMQTPR